MNKKRLLQLGVPADCVPAAVAGLHAAAKDRRSEFKPKKLIPQIVAQPELFTTDAHFQDLARDLIEFRASVQEPTKIEFEQWGQDLDTLSLQQMDTACHLPVARAAALMPDAHAGYGLPIGGVLACENAVVPYAVGVDIACRMRLTVTDLDVSRLDDNNQLSCQELDRALENGTLFGTGQQWKTPYHHDVLDEDWTVTAVTREVKDRAVKQLGTSGSGNHFVEWGILELPEDDLGLSAGRYVTLLSHSGSRGAGARVCQRYSDIARRKIPHRYREDKHLRHLAWLSLDDEAGAEYWEAMNLMGRYAAANHEVIHENVTELSGAEPLAVIENHHNFAWLEEHGGKNWVVHRKGATPAGEGVMGVIPGNMADPAFVVRGKGQTASLHSASHGAGRRMSHTEARRTFSWSEWRRYLEDRQVRLLAGGLDEVPGAYKDIHDVMAAQTDLVDVVGRFLPKIVMMCGDGSRPED